MKTFPAFDHRHSTALVLFFLLAPMPNACAQSATAAPGSTDYHIHAVVLVVLILCLLALLFWLLLRWSHRLDQASYLGEVYRESVEDFEYKRLAAGPTEKIRDLTYYRDVTQDAKWLKDNPRPTPPPGVPQLPLDWSGVFPWVGRGTGSGDSPSDEVRGDVSLTETDSRIRDYYTANADWERKVGAEVNSRLRDDLNEARARAKERVKSAADVDLSALRGRGAEFVLEFTTVVVIIFTALILGVLRILSTEQIGTLLAAIAGYVLGRATTSRTRPAGSTAAESQPAAQEQKKPGEAGLTG